MKNSTAANAVLTAELKAYLKQNGFKIESLYVTWNKTLERADFTGVLGEKQVHGFYAPDQVKMFNDRLELVFSY